MTDFTWLQVIAYRVAQHHLDRRATRKLLLDVIAALGGLHAQIMAAAEWSAWNRVENLESDAIHNALWADRTLVKLWVMRGTLHLICARDFPMYVAGTRTRDNFRKGAWLRYHNLTLDQIEGLIEAAGVALDGRALTREQLADEIARITGDESLREKVLSGWGEMLKPVAFQGRLCFGPNDGQNVTFVRPDQWIGAWQDIDSQAGLLDIVRRYLSTYGPSTPDEFARWWGIPQPAPAKQLFRALADETIEVSVEGWQAWALTPTVEAIQNASPSQTVRLLPYFDPYTVAHSRQREHIMDAAYADRVYRPQAWISPVVLVGGRIMGTWKHDAKGKIVRVTVEPFEKLASTIQDQVEAEAANLGAFLGSAVEVAWAA